MGRGLAAYEGVKLAYNKVIETGDIDPREIEFDIKENGRKYPPTAVMDMACSLLENGQKAPIRLRTNPETKKKHLTFGFRRVLGALQIIEAGTLDKVFKLRYELVEESAEEARISNYIENFDREDLTLVDHIENLGYMRDTLNMKGVEIHKRINKSTAWVSQVLNCIGKFPAAILRAIAAGHISQQEAFDLAHLSDEAREAGIQRLLAEQEDDGAKPKRRKKSKLPKILTGKQARLPFMVEVEQQQEKEGELDPWGQLSNYLVKYMSNEIDYGGLKRRAKKLLENG